MIENLPQVIEEIFSVCSEQKTSGWLQ